MLCPWRTGYDGICHKRAGGIIALRATGLQRGETSLSLKITGLPPEYARRGATDLPPVVENDQKKAAFRRLENYLLHCAANAAMCVSAFRLQVASVMPAFLAFL